MLFFRVLAVVCVLDYQRYVVLINLAVLFIFQQNAAYEVRISDWSSGVCSSDLQAVALAKGPTRLASLSRVVVVRQSDGQRKAAMFDLGAIRKGEAPDPEILPGDTIIVGQIGRAHV